MIFGSQSLLGSTGRYFKLWCYVTSSTGPAQGQHVPDQECHVLTWHARVTGPAHVYDVHIPYPHIHHSEVYCIQYAHSIIPHTARTQNTNIHFYALQTSLLHRHAHTHTHYTQICATFISHMWNTCTAHIRHIRKHMNANIHKDVTNISYFLIKVLKILVSL